jgi:hypothetical protein
MKTFIITLMILTGAMAARAQERTTLSPDTAKVTYKTSPYIITENVPVAAVESFLKKSNMPVAKLPNTSANMPITKTDRTKYTMPIAGYLPKSINQKITIIDSVASGKTTGKNR